MKEQKISFEEALAQLEKAVQSLEKGDLSLDETIARFEDGVKMVRICRQKLDEAEKKIEILLPEQTGSGAAAGEEEDLDV